MGEAQPTDAQHDQAWAFIEEVHGMVPFSECASFSPHDLARLIARTRNAALEEAEAECHSGELRCLALADVSVRETRREMFLDRAQGWRDAFKAIRARKTPEAQ